MLYGREEVENRNGSLNNTIFRLRKSLRNAGLPESNYIIIQNGICRWDNAIPVEVDILQFEELIEKGRQEEDIQKKMDAYMEACKIYKGEFLPNMIGEDWVGIRNINYQHMYTSVMKELCEWLKGQGRFEDIYRLSSVAADIYPFEDWGIYQIDSLMAMSRYGEAMAIYEKVTKMFFDELGLQPSDEMLSRVHLMAERVSQSSEVISDIKKRFREREASRGAYYCTYPSFVDAYRVISRMMERNGMSVYLMLCTLTRVKEKSAVSEKQASGELKEAIKISLRRGDFYTRYNEWQYLIMLPGINQENCSKVSSRIEATFSRNVKKSAYRINYYIASVAEVDEDYKKEDHKNPGFRSSGNLWG